MDVLQSHAKPSAERQAPTPGPGPADQPPLGKPGGEGQTCHQKCDAVPLHVPTVSCIDYVGAIEAVELGVSCARHRGTSLVTSLIKSGVEGTMPLGFSGNNAPK